MAAPYSALESKLEAAIAAYLATQVLGTTNIYTGENNGDKATPCVQCEVMNGPELEANTGIYNLTAKVIIYTAAPDEPGNAGVQKAAHDQLVGKTFDALEIGNLAAMLTFYGVDLTVQGVVFGERGHTQSGDEWENSLMFTAPCSGQAIP